MNLIVNRQLERQEEQAIYELTLKKQRSKKSTVSEKHTAAMKQLAEELVRERKQLRSLADEEAQNGALPADGLLPFHKREQILCRCSSMGAILQRTSTTSSSDQAQARARHKQHREEDEDEEETSRTGETDLVKNERQAASAQSKQAELQRQSSTSSIATDTTASSSSSSSSSSSTSAVHLRLHHVPSSASSLQQHEQRRARDKLRSPNKSISFLSSAGSTGSSTGAILSDGANIKLSQLRLEQLNNELERRLHQYEYLVSQEKAILGAYNLNPFTSEGVNNFQRFEVHKQKQMHSSHSWSNFHR